MRIALVNPTCADDVRRQANIPPVRVCYAAGLLERHGHDVLISDGKVSANSEVCTAIERFCPDIVVFYYGLSFTSLSGAVTRNLKSLLAAVTQRLPGTPLAIMGPHVRALGTKLLEDADLTSHVRMFLKGEENDLLNLAEIQQLTDDRLLRVSGILLRVNGKWISTGEAEPLTNLECLGSQSFSGLDLSRYRQHAIVATRGCPFKCAFCCVPLIDGGRDRCRSATSIVTEMESLIHDHGSKPIVFVDDNLLVRKPWFNGLLDEMCNSPYSFEWSCVCGVRVDAIDPGMLRKARTAGCIEIGFGAETGDNRVLAAMGKKFRRADIIRAVRMTEATGVRAQLFLMVGGIGETPTSRRATRDLFFNALPSNVVANYAYPLENTTFARWVGEHGRILEGSVHPQLFAHYRNYKIPKPTFDTKDFPAWERYRTLLEYFKMKTATHGFIKMLSILLRFLKQNGFTEVVEVPHFLAWWVLYRWKRLWRAWEGVREAWSK